MPRAIQTVSYPSHALLLWRTHHAKAEGQFDRTSTNLCITSITVPDFANIPHNSSFYTSNSNAAFRVLWSALSTLQQSPSSLQHSGIEALGEFLEPISNVLTSTTLWSMWWTVIRGFQICWSTRLLSPSNRKVASWVLRSSLSSLQQFLYSLQDSATGASDVADFLVHTWCVLVW